MMKDLLFALELGLRVIVMFILCLYIGIKLDTYFHTAPFLLLGCLLIAFLYVIKLLLGVGKHE